MRHSFIFSHTSQAQPLWLSAPNPATQFVPQAPALLMVGGLVRFGWEPPQELGLTALTQHVQPSSPRSPISPKSFPDSSTMSVHPLSKHVRKQGLTTVLAAWVSGKGCAAASPVRAWRVISACSAHLDRVAVGCSLAGIFKPLLPLEHLVHDTSPSRAQKDLQTPLPAAALSCKGTLMSHVGQQLRDIPKKLKN